MKRILFFLFGMVSCFFAYGQQWSGTTPGNIYYNQGNVGLGTNAPQESLHINGNVRGNGTGGALRVKTENGYVEIGPRNTSWSHFMTDRNNFYFNKGIWVSGVFSSYYNNNLDLRAGGVTRIFADVSTGNVGIGTTTPDSKLSVNGNIRAHEIKLETTNWPDYVFNKDYKLASLEETKAFIKENGHLPGLKSAKEYQEKGVDMMELNQKLLEKIEELTLHLIVVNKKRETDKKSFDTKLNEIYKKLELLRKDLEK